MTLELKVRLGSRVEHRVWCAAAFLGLSLLLLGGGCANRDGVDSSGQGGSASGAAGTSGIAGSMGTAGISATAGMVGAAGTTGAAGGTTGTAGMTGSAGTTGTAGAAGAAGAAQACGAGDMNLPAEPTIPGACATLQATQNVAANGVASENNADTPAIQAALDTCGPGRAVRLTASGSNNAFLTGPLKVPAGVTLWIDAGTTLYGTRDPKIYGTASALITVSGASSGIVGDGIIDGQGGEPNVGSSQSWWDQNAGSSGNSPALIQVSGATNFTLYRITLHNSPKFHVKLGAAGFVVWGVTIKTPSKPTNSAGTALTYTSAHNTDGIDPGEAASDGYIVCSMISDGATRSRSKDRAPRA